MLLKMPYDKIKKGDKRTKMYDCAEMIRNTAKILNDLNIYDILYYISEG